MEIFIHKILVKQKLKPINNSVSDNQSKENNDEFQFCKNAAENSSVQHGEIFESGENFFSQNSSENNSNGKPLRNNDGKTPDRCLRTKAQGIYKTKLGKDIVQRHES